MVNQITDNKLRILELLYRADGRTLSGVEISQATGISRVAAWKHIRALKEAGIAIESGAKGYVLTDPENLLLPFCFPESLGDRIHYFSTRPSTMDTARQMAADGAPHMTCVVSEHQTKGRGRLNRQWESHQGGLWFTLVLTPRVPPPLAYLYNFMASMSLSLTLERLYGLDVRVKWPNDLLLEGRKLTGLLSEMETRGDMIRFLLLGVGINVNNTPDSKAFSAISLKQALGRSVSRKKILAAFLADYRDRITAMASRPDPGEVISQWKTRTATIGTRVEVQTPDRTVKGLALDVDDTGALLVETPDHTRKKIIYGDCFHT